MPNEPAESDAMQWRIQKLLFPELRHDPFGGEPLYYVRDFTEGYGLGEANGPWSDSCVMAARTAFQLLPLRLIHRHLRSLPSKVCRRMRNRTHRRGDRDATIKSSRGDASR